MLENETNLSLYLKISRELKEKIINGEYKSRELLPSELVLCDIYKVSRVTIRKALAELEKDNLIIRRAGFGTIINHDNNDLKNFTLVQSFSNEMKESTSSSCITFTSSLSIVFEKSSVDSLFRDKYTDKLYNLKRLRGAEDKPIVYSDTWLNLPIDLPTDREFLFGSLYQYLIDNNIIFSRFEEELEAIIPDDELRKVLKITKKDAVLKRIRKGYDLNNKLIEYTINYYDAKLYHYTVEVASIKSFKGN